MSQLQNFCFSFVLVSLIPIQNSIVQGEDQSIRYSRDIRPILAKKCLTCHGPDEENRDSEFRLDTEEGAFEDRDGVQGIVAGKPEESQVYQRIISEDEDEIMPPVDSKQTLTKKEIELIRTWIKQGGKYEKHWAFTAPVRPKLPIVKNQYQAKNQIDNFILEKAEKDNLKLSPEADRYTLIRRLYLDLTGLLPTTKETDEFVNDTDPLAYEKLVEKLLASPSYGEKWARHWLDLARYADTNGYEKDRPRSIWKYREYVINAFNKDMPFDQFTIEQIAGDLIPNATFDQLVATGFHRNTMLNEEGGTEVEQFRFEAMVDRVNTTGAVWLGLTMACAQCHTHKYDPITQTEYYQLFAFLNNADEPNLLINDSEITKKRQAQIVAVQKLEKELESKWPAKTKEKKEARDIESAYKSWLAEKKKLATNWETVKTDQSHSKKGTTFEVLEDQSLLAGGNQPNNDVYTIEISTDVKNITAIRLEALPHKSLPGNGPGRAPYTVTKTLEIGNYLLSEIQVYNVSKKGEPKRVKLQNPTHSYTSERCSSELTIDGNMDTGWSIGERCGEPHHVVYELEKPIKSESPIKLKIVLHQIYIHGLTLGRFRISTTSDEFPVRSSGLRDEIESVLIKPESNWTEEDKAKLKLAFLMTAPELKKEQDGIRLKKRTLPNYNLTLVMKERKPQHSRVTKRHHRGEYLKPKEEVKAGVPKVFHQLPPKIPKNRMALARWLVDRKNPLVARVVMNRHWQAFFGRGIVETAEDFGTQSSPPTHQDLLDWLAVEFMDKGWSFKHMHRLIVNSATYKQQSNISPELLKKDPKNLLLVRGPRFRVDAETVRDIALSATGILKHKLGGPSVFPPRPKGMVSLSYGKLAWKTETGPNRYRRGLYTFLKRTDPYAMFGTFDAPSGETCVVKRSRSNTPLQALTLLNDPVFNEAAKKLALHELQTGSFKNEQIAVDIFRRFLTRNPSEEELKSIYAFYESQLKRFEKGELKSSEIVLEKNEKAPENINLNQWAAWTVVIRAVMNFDENITKG